MRTILRLLVVVATLITTPALAVEGVVQIN